MKKYTYKKYIQTMMLAVAVIPFFSSCDYLDKEPDDMLTIDAVFEL
jgi:lipoprotein